MHERNAFCRKYKAYLACLLQRLSATKSILPETFAQLKKKQPNIDTQDARTL